MSVRPGTFLLLSVFGLVLLSGVLTQMFIVQAGFGPADLPLTGFIWGADNGQGVGIISFCGGENNELCPGRTEYQVVIDNNTGEFRGHAWSGVETSTGAGTLRSGFGWLSFNRSETGPPPRAPFNGSESFIARIDPNGSEKRMEGWARFLAACDWSTVEQKCLSSGPGLNAGNWDGWVNFSAGVAGDGTPYDGFIATTTGQIGRLIGFAWGSSSTGWLAASSSGTFGDRPPRVGLPQLSANLTAHPTTGIAPLTVTLTATVQTSTTLPITYDFICDTNGGNLGIFSTTINATTTSTSCDFTTPGNYRPLVTISQNGVFATAQASSLVTNIDPGAGGNLIVRRGIIREIPVDE